ncbi:MAG TPA: suppressor of fused domain protein [Mycobacteriales bacterium]|nr:suppressor of fused domain protein [Mycobacteriales bacterium]
MGPRTGVDAQGAIEAHLRHGFPGQRVVVQGWRTDAMSAPHVRVLRVDPETRGGLWLHVSSGASVPAPGALPASPIGSEFVLVTPFKTLRAVELLAMVVYFQGVQELTVGDTVSVGEPWLPGSSCGHLLVSAPYLLADEMWTLQLPGREVHFRWVIPITAAERAYAQARGLDALEQRFEEAGLEYWDPHRASVV